VQRRRARRGARRRRDRRSLPNDRSPAAARAPGRDRAPRADRARVGAAPPREAAVSGIELTVGWPIALYGLLLIPLVALLALRSRYPVGPRRRALVLATRALSIALIVAAVSDVRLGWPTEELAVATVVDPSASVSAADRARVRQELDALAEERADVAWVAPPQEAGVEPATDVSVGVAMLPRDRVRRMIVATDGRDRGG